MTALHSTTIGEAGPPIVFCHGLFGQGKNWTQIAKRLAGSHRITLLDMPNHGRSEWTDAHDYAASAEAVAAEIRELDQGPVALVGHSMGGKIAMLVALRHPDLVERLCVVDISPVAHRNQDEFRGYLDGMLGMDLAAIETRADADEALTSAAPHPTVRSFLLQNLRRTDDGWHWQPNLRVLRRDLDQLGDWPEEQGTYDGPVLWMGGADSDYVTDEHAPAMEALFPRVRRVTVKNAGHWVHSQQPEVFTEVLRRFLDGPAGPSDDAEADGDAAGRE